MQDQSEQKLKSLERSRRLIYGLPVPKSPFGNTPLCYIDNPENPKEIIPVQEKLELMFKALEFYKSCSSREVAVWLSKHGIKISHQGFQLFAKTIPLSKEIFLPLEERIAKYG